MHLLSIISTSLCMPIPTPSGTTHHLLLPRSCHYFPSFSLVPVICMQPSASRDRFSEAYTSPSKMTHSYFLFHLSFSHAAIMHYLFSAFHILPHSFPSPYYTDFPFSCIHNSSALFHFLPCFTISSCAESLLFLFLSVTPSSVLLCFLPPYTILSCS